MVLTTTNNIENFNIQKYIGIISTQEVLGVNILSDMIASISDIVGGTSGTYRNRLSEIYESAILSLKKQAITKGANAVLGINVYINEISGKSKQMFMITITGTAVIIVPDRYHIFKKLSELNLFKKEGLIEEEEYEYERKKIIASHTNSIQEETEKERIKVEIEKQAILHQEQEAIKEEMRKNLKAKIEADKTKRLQYRSIIENLTEEDLANAECNLEIDTDLNMYENCKSLINKGKCAEAALYYVKETGLSLNDAIDYIREV